MKSDTETRQEEFLALVEPLYDKLERFCRVMTGNNEEARDVVSETLLQAYRSFDSVRNHNAFLSFLFTVSTRIYRRQFRKNRFRGIYNEERALQLHDTNHSPETATDIALLYEAIRQLPDKQREAIVLFELLDLPLEEVRRIQGGTLSAVKVRLMRARQRLTAILRPHFDTQAAPSFFFSQGVVETLL